MSRQGDDVGGYMGTAAFTFPVHSGRIDVHLIRQCNHSGCEHRSNLMEFKLDPDALALIGAKRAMAAWSGGQSRCSLARPAPGLVFQDAQRRTGAAIGMVKVLGSQIACVHVCGG